MASRRVIAGACYGPGTRIWKTMSTNLGPTLQEYLDRYPDRGMMPVTQAAIGIFSACAGRTLFTKWIAAAPDGTDPDVWETRWRDRMTAVWMRVLFPEGG